MYLLRDWLSVHGSTLAICGFTVFACLLANWTARQRYLKDRAEDAVARAEERAARSEDFVTRMAERGAFRAALRSEAAKQADALSAIAREVEDARAEVAFERVSAQAKQKEADDAALLEAEEITEKRAIVYPFPVRS